MVKGDKRNKREYERRNQGQKPSDKSKDDNKDVENPQAKDGNPPSNFKGVQEDAAKLITEANKRFVEESKKKVPVEKDDKWTKTIVSNWDRYEIIEDDENEEQLTGETWELAMSSGSSSQSHVKLQDERSWSTSGETGLSQQFFNLDIGVLDELIKCIPTHLQIDLKEESCDADTLDMFNNKALENNKLIGMEKPDSVELNNKLLSHLSLSDNKIEKKSCDNKTRAEEKSTKEESNGLAHKEIKDSESKPKTTPPLTTKAKSPSPSLASKASKSETPPKEPPSSAPAALSPPTTAPVPIAAPQEQRQRRQRNRRGADRGEDTSTKESTPKKDNQEGSKTSEESSIMKSAEDVPKPAKNAGEDLTKDKDLQFLEMMEKGGDVSEEATVKEEAEINDATEKKNVVPVAVIDEGEKKGLEDWLDEFLGD